MSGWQKQARATTASRAWLAACLCVSTLVSGAAAAQIVANPDGTFSAVALDAPYTALVWQLVIGGIVIVAFLTAIILWVSAALRRARHAKIRRGAVVSSALNSLTTGLVLVAAFVALPQIPPRNVVWIKEGKWVRLAKAAFEKYFLNKVRTGNTHPVIETYVLKLLGIRPLKGERTAK